MATKAKAAKPKAAIPSGWKKVERGAIVPWEKGMSVTGKFVEVRSAGKGNVLDMRVDGKLITLGAPTILVSMLRGFDKGDALYIECSGKTVETANGKAWGFEVYAPERASQEDLPF